MVLRRFFIETGYTSNNPSDWNRIEQSGLPTNMVKNSMNRIKVVNKKEVKKR